MPNPLHAFDFLLLPGRDNADPDHWLSHWETHFPGMTRVVQDEWVAPKAEPWIRRLDEYLAKATRPVVLIAHSLGTSLVMQWASRAPVTSVVGAFLVAPSDRGPADIWSGGPASGFAPMVLKPFPFPSVVLASRNDPYVSFDRASLFAASWGSDLIDMGDSGHMGNSDQIGIWPEGLFQLGCFAGSLHHAASRDPVTTR